MSIAVKGPANRQQLIEMAGLELFRECQRINLVIKYHSLDKLIKPVELMNFINAMQGKDYR